MIDVKVGDVNIILTVNRALTDTGSSMLRLPQKDFLRVLTAYCKHIELNQPKRTRENRFNLLECYRDEDWAYIDNCNIKKLNTDLPDLKI